jgi:hypothetical protein
MIDFDKKTSLIKALELGTHYLQSYDGLLQKKLPKYSKKSIMTLQILKIKLKSLNQTCISSRLIMQIPKTILLDPPIFIEG